MTFATTQRLLMGLAVLLILTPTFLYGAGKLGRAPMYDGDVRKEVTCLTCNGLGRTGEDACSTCYGRGVAEFIYPGPHRPLQMVGTVYNASGQKIEGAEVGVKIADPAPGEDAGQELVFRTNADGQFGVKVPPGSYIFRVVADGSKQIEETVVVTADSKPLPANSTETLNKLEREFRLL